MEGRDSGKLKNLKEEIMKKIFIAILLICAVILTIVGCSTGVDSSQKTTAGNEKKELFKLKVPTQTSATEILVADELGYYKEEGIEIEDIGVLKSGEDIAATLTGSNDVFTGHPNTVAKAILGGAKVKIVAAGMVDNPVNFHMGYFVKTDGPIQSAQDFLKKKVKVAVSGLNSCTDLLVLEWLSQNNIPKEQVEFTVMPDSQQEQALSQGLVDLAVLHPPFILKAKSDPKVKLLFTSWDIVKNPASGTSIRGFSEKFINEHPDVVTGFIRASAKARKWINANQEEAIKIFAKRMDVDPSKVSLFYFDDNDYIQESYIKTWLDLMIKHGQLQEGQIKVTDIYTNDYNPYYKKQ